MSRVLIANRGEIALRIQRAAAELGVEAVAVYSEDDARCRHVLRADRAHALTGEGPAAYLDIDQILAAARASGCDVLHPGYGFLSESAELAARCAQAGIRFVGPRPEVLECFGDKGRARVLARECGVVVPAGSSDATTLEAARQFFASLPRGSALMIKAIAGGGGRGMAIVSQEAELEPAYERCSREAQSAFGRGDVYVEQCIAAARHIEVQIVGDGDDVVHLHERECSVQRRHQKLIELAPSPGLSGKLRQEVLESALALAREVSFDGVGTFEFLVDEAAGTCFFIEANPRIQVEHTVTEEVTGVDLVRTQLQIAGGQSLAELGLSAESVPPPVGIAMQLRINAERMDERGRVLPTGGVLQTIEFPAGPGVRVDSHAYGGYAPSPRFDSLLAKLIVHTPSGDYQELVGKAERALSELETRGFETNARFLAALLAHEEFRANRVHTRFVEQELDALLAATRTGDATDAHSGLAGARIDVSDPLAVLAHGKQGDAPIASPAASAVPGAPAAPPESTGPPGTIPVRAPLQGTILSLLAAPGAEVYAGQPLLIMEAMKMEHLIEAPADGIVRLFGVSEGDAVLEGHALVHLEEGEFAGDRGVESGSVDLERVRPDLAEALERHEKGLDAARPAAVARRRKTGQQTTRENIAALCDDDSFVEYGPLVVAAQRRRRSVEDLIENTPADGMVTGVGQINRDLFGSEASQCVVMSYDYTVLAGTQGQQNHRKKDRMFELADRLRIPLVLFTEGGGGRPGDTDGLGVAGLDCMAFRYFAELSGRVPLVGINSGRCFAGNAALLGCCDVVIATANSNIGMGGPAMIEGGGLGIFRPEDVGPMSVQVPNGVVDLPVADEVEAVAVARRYLSYFQGTTSDWSAADQRLLRSAIPENRLRVYEVRDVIETLADEGSVLEVRRGFGIGMVTALARIEGRPIGIIANNPKHLAGAIDSAGADKAARFMQLCDAFDIPLLLLCDTPGIMVGPEVEKSALVRHAARLFVTAASLDVPFFTIILRKGYGLGAQAMAGGSFKSPLFTVAWPTGEFGGMGLEGAVKLGYRKELEAVADPEERKALFETMVDRMYQHGKAVNTASHFEIDDVIDPADSRRWILSALRSAPPPERRGRKRPFVDTW